jgi:hypothetical protein
VDEADAYRVLLLDAGLAEVARLGPTQDTTLALDPDRVLGLQRHARAAYWQVEALRERDVIASSLPRPWTPPGR